MKKSLGVIGILLLVSFSGCAPATTQGLRQKHANKYSFVADENYQSVYRKAIEQARNCYQRGLITAQMVVQGDLYTDIKQGHISVAMHGGFGVDTYLSIDIIAVEENKTNVIVYSALSTWNEQAINVKRWVLGDYQGCDLHPINVKRVPFPIEELEKLPRTGTAVVVGQAYLNDENEKTKYADERTVMLVPVTSYSDQWYETFYIKGRLLESPDPRYKNYYWYQTADKEGRFEFKNIPAGEFYLYTFIKWVNSDVNQRIDDPIAQKITVQDGETLRIILTR